MSNMSRKEASSLLSQEMDITIGYALTLYQSHRKAKSEVVGEDCITIYKVRDTRSNRPTEPYMSSMIKNNPDPSEARSQQEAINAYVLFTETQIKLAKQL